MNNEPHIDIDNKVIELDIYDVVTDRVVEFCDKYMGGYKKENGQKIKFFKGFIEVSFSLTKGNLQIVNIKGWGGVINADNIPASFFKPYVINTSRFI